MPLVRDPEGVETGYIHDFIEFAKTRVFEVGCGNGRLMWRYAERVNGAIGIDVDPARLEAGLVERPVRFQQRTLLVTASALEAPVPSAAFDCVVLGWSL
jgi:ubiquinone/menaquinone biosynthesis C-methylase UbiE